MVSLPVLDTDLALRLAVDIVRKCNKSHVVYNDHF